MFKQLKNRRAQAVMGEYTLVIFLVVAALAAMTIYFKRAVQARIFDARNYMVREVRERTAGEYDGPLYREYEPYYVNTDSIISRRAEHIETIDSGWSSGIYEKVINQTTKIDVISETAPPKEFNRTTPRR